MPAPSKLDRTKVLSVRFTDEEYEVLSARAVELGIGPSTLARTLVRRGLMETPPAQHVGTPSRLPSVLESRLESLLAAELVARVEALERRVAGR